MIQSRKFVAAAILVGIAMIAAGLLIAPFGTSARAAASQEGDAVTDRIGATFAAISEREPDAALAAAAARFSKGDLGADPACFGAAWPNIDPSCLTKADGSTVKAVRMITIGYQSDASTTVLVRIPAGEVASR